MRPVPAPSAPDRFEVSSRPAIPVLVDKVFRGSLPKRSEPLRTERRHPDEVTFGHRIPMIAESVDTTARQHQQPVFHNVDLNHRKGRAGKKGHAIYGEVEARIGRKKSANFESVIAHERRGGNIAFAAG